MNRDGALRVLAVGAGPANLSLAALAEPVDGLRVTALEARDSVAWHPGLLWTDSRLQVSAVKDLVTLVDPRSRFGFLSFLHERGRLYRHLIAAADHVSRKEFDQYFTWAAQQLDVRLGERVEAVEHDGDGFAVRTGRRVHRADHVVLGVGRTPYVPDFARGVTGRRLWHAADHLGREDRLDGRDVLLVGGGQSAAEVALDLMSGRAGLPRRLTWVTGREGFAPLDDSPFADEWFNPRYVEYFRELPAGRRAALLERQRSAGTGITRELLARVYERLYALDYLTDGPFTHDLLAGVRLTGLADADGGFRAELEDTVTGGRRALSCDTVVLATGYRTEIPSCMDGLRDRMPVTDDGYAVEADYRVRWEGPDRHRIYVQGAARHTHGVADPNLSLAAWRSAVILNSLLGREHYDLKADESALGPRDRVGDRP
ncbi:lysine N(6)-hydroxylase/L-ornithine N(5)-oxygenase family protein [Streptomyces sp. NPDC021100]|uniref:lysine N(6)-hydroxylase/L-ornithine N(5)-oxygenase family protein n=1 Tax=Streptomyces sp. NPDC021100 TaxID=3365114 RepID=UPI0037996F1C